MNKKNHHKANGVRWLLVIGLLLWLLCDITYRFDVYNYYSQKDNYINVEGIVKGISYRYNPKNQSDLKICLSVSPLNYKLDGVGFKIVGDSAVFLQEIGIKDKLQVGSRISFITAPQYFYDAYVMPIVALSVNGEKLLTFEEGFANFMKWLYLDDGFFSRKRMDTRVRRKKSV